ncbi:antibiotic biosynthesis monooxygenase [Cyclobacterium sediminis]
MEKISQTLKPPYYAVIFTSIKSDHLENYDEEALRMENLVKSQPGYLGHESASAEIGITVSYWKDLESIKAWKKQKDHRLAQVKGKSTWYSQYKIRICKVEKEYGV